MSCWLQGHECKNTANLGKMEKPPKLFWKMKNGSGRTFWGSVGRVLKTAVSFFLFCRYGLLKVTLTTRSALFSSISCLVIYLMFISQQIQGKPLSCECFHKAEMEPAISAARRAKLTKTPHIMSRWLIIRRRMLQLPRWKRINKRFRAPRLPRGRAFHQLTSSSGGGALFIRGRNWEEIGMANWA